MNFDKENYTVEELTLENETIRFRAYRNLIYVDKPVNEAYQQMNIFVPEIYFEGGSVNGYTLKTVPVFMPNSVGGYILSTVFRKKFMNRPVLTVPVSLRFLLNLYCLYQYRFWQQLG